MACTRSLFAALAAAAIALPAAAHEFWIAPADYTLDAGQDLVASLNVGEDFTGDTLSYLPQRFVSFELQAGEDRFALPGRLGDDPAVNVSDLPDGLLTLAYVSRPSEVTYDDATVYARFLETEGLDGIEARNQARGLDPVGMSERFTRYARSLVASGDGAGADRPMGLRLEIVAETNPYASEAAIVLRVLREGVAYPGAPLRVLARAEDGTIGEARLRTDSEGRSTVEAPPGSEILANVVWLEETDPAKTGAPWHSHWASLTFRRDP